MVIFQESEKRAKIKNEDPTSEVIDHRRLKAAAIFLCCYVHG